MALCTHQEHIGRAPLAIMKCIKTQEEIRDSFQQGHNAIALPDRMEYRDLRVRDNRLNRLLRR
jgi:hypothetical protein